MNNTFFVWLLLLLSVSCSTAHAQIGTLKWPFQNRAQVERATKANLQNLRASYEIIMSARRLGFSQSVLKVYEREASKGPLQAPDKVAAGYAFAFWAHNTGIRWNWKADTTPGICKTTMADAIRITFYRERSFTALPNSPEVLLFEALFQDRAGTDLVKNSRRRLQLLDQAIKRAPRWADLHYWRSQALWKYVGNLPVAKAKPIYPTYLRKSLAALERAIKLDPGFQREGIVNKMGLYQKMNKPREALAALDAYARIHPVWATRSTVKARRQSFFDEIRKQTAKS